MKYFNSIFFGLFVCIFYMSAVKADDSFFQLHRFEIRTHKLEHKEKIQQWHKPWLTPHYHPYLKDIEKTIVSEFNEKLPEKRNPSVGKGAQRVGCSFSNPLKVRLGGAGFKLTRLIIETWDQKKIGSPDGVDTMSSEASAIFFKYGYTDYINALLKSLEPYLAANIQRDVTAINFRDFS